MGPDFKSLIEDWDGEAVIIRFDRPSGTWIFIAIHSSVLGTPLGGCRMKVYPCPEDGLRDAMRLAEGMTYKWAAINFEFGGGKSVLAVPHDLDPSERVGLLQRFGRLLQSLNGAYATGEDLGTTPADMAVIARETEFVHGVDRAQSSAVDPGPYTAHGIFHGIRAAVARVFGNGGLEGRTVLIQGVGDVGAPLARMISDAGGRVLVSDVDTTKARKVAEDIGGELVQPHYVYSTACDVFAPCAIGGVLNAQTIAQLHCRIVAGSANNQLAEERDAARLHERGILYVPDYIVNAGGAVALPMKGKGESEEVIHECIRAIGRRVHDILTTSYERAEPPLTAARRLVQEVLERSRPAR